MSLFLCAMTASASLYFPPSGGWLHAYDGTVDPTTVGWAHNNPGDAWDGSGLSSGAAGGAEVQAGGEDSYWRIQDQLGSGSSNQKLFFHNQLTAGIPVDPLAPGGPGVTLSFRTRLPTTTVGGGIYVDPNGFKPPTGSLGGSGMFEVFTGNRNLPDGPNTTKAVAFSMGRDATAGDVLWLSGSDTFLGPVETVPINDVTAWHEVWITIAPISGTTHAINVYLDGSETPHSTTVDSGRHDIGAFDPSIAMGVPSTGGTAEFDVDFYNVAFGSFAPVAIVPEPSVAALIAMGALALGFRRMRR